MTPEEAIAAAARRAMRAIDEGAALGDAATTLALLEATSGELSHAASHVCAQVNRKEHRNSVTAQHLHESLRMVAVAALLTYATSQEAEEADADEPG